MPEVMAENVAAVELWSDGQLFGWDAALTIAQASLTRYQFGELICKLRVLVDEANKIQAARAKAERARSQRDGR